MGINNIFQFVKQMSVKITPKNYSSVSSINSAAHIAFMRQLQREMKKENVLEVPLSLLPVTVFDLETTGFFPQKGDRILSIGAVKMQGADILDQETFYSLIHSEEGVSPEISELTGIKAGQLQQAPAIGSVLKEFYQYAGSLPLVAHHAQHEKKFMQHLTWVELKTHFQHRVIDTSFLTKVVYPDIQLITLDECCAYFGIAVGKRHHALEDALITAKLWGENIRFIQELGFQNLKDVYSHLAKQ